MSPVGGTYRLAVCRSETCGSKGNKDLIISGILVLLDSSLTRARFERTLGAQLSVFIPDTVNGCFALTRARQPVSFVGIDRWDATVWRRGKNDADTVRFSLYHSPDASYDVSVVASGDTLRGFGQSYTANVEPFVLPREGFVAIRMGPPDLTKCRLPVR
jgi:hypothetical protein